MLPWTKAGQVTYPNKTCDSVSFRVHIATFIECRPQQEYPSFDFDHTPWGDVLYCDLKSVDVIGVRYLILFIRWAWTYTRENSPPGMLYLCFIRSGIRQCVRILIIKGPSTTPSSLCASLVMNDSTRHHLQPHDHLPNLQGFDVVTPYVVEASPQITGIRFRYPALPQVPAAERVEGRRFCFVPFRHRSMWTFELKVLQ